MLKPLPKKKWTCLVYMAGDNNLDPNGVEDIAEMKKVGSTPALNVVVEFDRAAPHQAKRYLLRKGGKASADAVADVGRVDTGDPKCLLDFIKWGVKYFPADHYLLVLWNHGQGWDDTDIYANERHRGLRRLATGRVRHSLFHTPVRRLLGQAIKVPNTRAILLDDDAKDFLDNIEMKKVLAAVAKLLKRKVDVLGMDACLMSMAEVGYQIRGGAEYTVGSEETEPLEGWPYGSILAELARKPDMTPEALSSLIVRKYIASYPKGSVTQSACDLSRADDLADAVTDLAKALTSGLANETIRQEILTARTKAQSYEVHDNIDLLDFCSLLSNGAAGPEINRCCRKVTQAAQAGYVVAQGSKGSDLAQSHGVAIYFPTQSVSPLYRGLDFSKKTGWGRFLDGYQTAVRSR